MDALFWIGFVACGLYVSFCFWSLSSEERAREAEAKRTQRDAKAATRLSLS